MVKKDKIRFLARKAYQIRQGVIKTIYEGRTGHIGGSMSIVDILTVLYFDVMKCDPKEPHMKNRDRFILSKGHGCPALYNVLAEKGYFPKSELKGFRQIDSLLQGHPEYNIPGIEVPSGSLGQGISAAVGMAIGFKYQQLSNRVYVVIGDGESQEGQVWEAAMCAGNKRLNNLTAFLDYNKLQGDGYVKDIMDLEPLANKWKAFNWWVKEIDGNDIDQIIDACKKAKVIKNKPQMIIAHTVKGKGVSFMEHKIEWHGTDPPSERQFIMAMEELKKKEIDI